LTLFALQDRVRIEAQVVAFGSAVSHALHAECRFLDAPCHFALKSRHKTKDGVPGYSMLSWHLTLLALAPYNDWRRAMLHIEKHVFSNHPATHVSHLSDAHITRNSKVRRAHHPQLQGSKRTRFLPHA
jgi:hypothetical protein